MASGFFLGGLAKGFESGLSTADQANYQTGLLKLAQQRQQQEQQNQQRNEFMQLRSQAIDHMGETISQLKIAHPDWSDMQLASNPAILAQKQQLNTFDKNLGLGGNDADSIVAGFAARPSQAVTEGAIARAKEGPQHQALVQSEINKNNALAGINPDGPLPGEGLGDKTSFNKRFAQVGQTDAAPNAEDALKSKYDARTLFKAEQYLGGNTSVLSGLGVRGLAGQERKKIQDAAADLAIARGMRPEDVNAEIAGFMGKKRAASAAGLRVGNVTVAMDAAQAASTRVLAASDKVSRTQYPSLNSVLLAAQRGTGDENVVQYGIAVNTLVNNYARAVGGGNAQLTDSARREAWDNLNTAWSKGQIKAAVEQINKEIASELSGAQKAMKDVTKSGEQSGGVTVHGFTFTPSGQ